jgi:hypothetical protein
VANTVIEQDDYRKIIELLEESDPFVLSPYDSTILGSDQGNYLKL